MASLRQPHGRKSLPCARLRAAIRLNLGVRLHNQVNPYQPPTADVASSPEAARRFGHSVMALSSAIVIPAAVAAIWWFATGTDTGLNQVSHLAGNVIIGGMIAAVVVYRHKAMPLWLASLVGPAVVLLLLVAPSIWAW